MKKIYWFIDKQTEKEMYEWMHKREEKINAEMKGNAFESWFMTVCSLAAAVNKIKSFKGLKKKEIDSFFKANPFIVDDKLQYVNINRVRFINRLVKPQNMIKYIKECLANKDKLPKRKNPERLDKQVMKFVDDKCFKAYKRECVKWHKERGRKLDKKRKLLVL